MVNHLTKLTLIILIGLAPFLSFAEATPEAGKSLFKANCAQCHAKNMKSNLTGPALGGVEERWADYPREDLYRWIRNSQALIKEGHPKAVELWGTWKPTVMQAFPNITDEDVESILLYVNAQLAPKAAVTGVGPGSPEVTKATTPSWWYYALFAFLGFLALVLARIISNLNVLAAAKDGTTIAQRTLWQTLTSKAVISFALFAAVILGGYTTVNNACLLYTSPSPRDKRQSRMPSSA